MHAHEYTPEGLHISMAYGSSLLFNPCRGWSVLSDGPRVGPLATQPVAIHILPRHGGVDNHDRVGISSEPYELLAF